MGELKIAYSDKKVTPWGGMKLLKNFIDHLEILSYMKQLNIPQPNSNAGYDPNILIFSSTLCFTKGGYSSSKGTKRSISMFLKNSCICSFVLFLKNSSIVIICYVLGRSFLILVHIIIICYINRNKFVLQDLF